MIRSLRELLQTHSIRRQLLLMLMLISSVTLISTTGAFVIKEAISMVKEQRAELTSLADILAKNTVASLTFDDPLSATETLAALKIRKNILAAYLIDTNGRIFSRYIAPELDLARLPPELAPFNAHPEQLMSLLEAIQQERDTLAALSDFTGLVHPIYNDNQQIGTLLLLGDRQRLWNDFFESMGTALLILLVVGTMAYLLSARLQQLISEPILKLSRMMQTVTATKDFSLRATTGEQTEIGQLFAGFNRMLGEIEERDLALQQRQEHLQQLAHFDTLTSLPNRMLFYDRFTQALYYAQRNNKKVALFFIDLDHFKDINDSLGHRIGDLLLREVSSRMSEVVRDCDTLARLGGDEFTIFAQNIDNRENADLMAQKLLDVLEPPFKVESHTIYVSASIGITLFPDDGDQVDELLINADVAMYNAKGAGKNTYRQFCVEMNHHNSERMLLQGHLRTALAHNEFVLHYQPKLDIATGRINGVEALVRWNHPELGLVQPGRFIGLAEESGMIVPLSEWVLKTACQQARDWHLLGIAKFSVAVNLSASHFKRHTVVEAVRDALEISGLPGKLLEVELTESLLMHNNQYTIEALHELKKLGLTISIDDFGTGYSSLSYLQRFPIDLIKIDRSFIWSMGHNENDRAIVTAIIAMAKSLRMRVIAEGVETEEQYQFLQEQGCHGVQGYLLSRPVPAEELTLLLQQQQLRLTEQLIS